MRITQLIRKHASLLALLACLAGVVAAPYLIPENPDSQAFRNGSFGALLLFACYFPLQQAFSRANLRTLICAAGTSAESYAKDNNIPYVIIEQ